MERDVEKKIAKNSQGMEYVLQVEDNVGKEAAELKSLSLRSKKWRHDFEQTNQKFC